MGRAGPHARRADHGGVCEAFVTFYMSKTKHAVAIADGGRGSEVRLRYRRDGSIRNETPVDLDQCRRLRRCDKMSFMLRYPELVNLQIPQLRQ